MAKLIERPPDSYIPPVIRKQRPPGIDAKRLAADLRRQVRGEVRFDAGSRALQGSEYLAIGRSGHGAWRFQSSGPDAPRAGQQ